MDVVWTKVVVMALTSVIPILLSLLPLWFKSYFVPSDHRQSAGRAFVVSVLLCFGAGVMMATAVVHMLPEVRGEQEGNGLADLWRQEILVFPLRINFLCSQGGDHCIREKSFQG